MIWRQTTQSPTHPGVASKKGWYRPKLLTNWGQLAQARRTRCDASHHWYPVISAANLPPTGRGECGAARADNTKACPIRVVLLVRGLPVVQEEHEEDAAGVRTKTDTHRR
jgi:hypothetical protein